MVVKGVGGSCSRSPLDSVFMAVIVETVDDTSPSTLCSIQCRGGGGGGRGGD